jgi:hypothetical protein
MRQRVLSWLIATALLLALVGCQTTQEKESAIPIHPPGYELGAKIGKEYGGNPSVWEDFQLYLKARSALEKDAGSISPSVLPGFKEGFIHGYVEAAGSDGGSQQVAVQRVAGILEAALNSTEYARGNDIGARFSENHISEILVYDAVQRMATAGEGDQLAFKSGFIAGYGEDGGWATYNAFAR